MSTSPFELRPPSTVVVRGEHRQRIDSGLKEIARKHDYDVADPPWAMSLGGAGKYEVLIIFEEIDDARQLVEWLKRPRPN